jgi:hypothetical protein
MMMMCIACVECLVRYKNRFLTFTTLLRNSLIRPVLDEDNNDVEDLVEVSFTFMN